MSRRLPVEVKRVRMLVTPEGVSLPLDLADAGQRMGAFLLDLLASAGRRCGKPSASVQVRSNASCAHPVYPNRCPNQQSTDRIEPCVADVAEAGGVTAVRSKFDLPL